MGFSAILEGMSVNPYESTTSKQATLPKTRPTMWLVWFGVAAIVVALLCVLLLVVGIVLTFNNIAGGAAQPDPADLANGISWSVLPTIMAIPLGVIGIALIVVGFVMRKPGGGAS